MLTWVYIDGWLECVDMDCFFYAALYPVVIRGEDCDVFFAEVMVVVFCVLEHCGLVIP